MIDYFNLQAILKNYADLTRYTFSHWYDGLPSITVLCPTFGRPELLNEAVYSVLNQNYAGTLKMIILNDQPELEIISTISRVKVINKKERYKTLADKRNDLIKLGDTDLCMLYGDDDILMPWAISTAVSAMVSHINFVILGYVKYNQKKNKAAYFPNTSLPGPILYNRSIVENHDIVLSHNPPGFELQFVAELQKHVPKELKSIVLNQSKVLPQDLVYYMARTNLDNHKPVSVYGYDNCGEFVKNLGLSGEFVINPKWDRDYERILNKTLNKMRFP